MMMTSKKRLLLTLSMALIIGSSTIANVLAAGGWRGGGGLYVGGWHGGGGWRGGGWNRGGRVGIYLGAPIGFNYGYSPYPYYGAPYYGSPYSYAPAPIYYPPVQSAPVIYIERKNEVRISSRKSPRNSSQTNQTSWWYYCVDSKSYYPYVKNCPEGWLRVAPEPAYNSENQPVVNNMPEP